MSSKKQTINILSEIGAQAFTIESIEDFEIVRRYLKFLEWYYVNKKNKKVLRKLKEGGKE